MTLDVLRFMTYITGFMAQFILDFSWLITYSKRFCALTYIRVLTA